MIWRNNILVEALRENDEFCQLYPGLILVDNDGKSGSSGH